jgi:hypothetical protein
LFVSKVSGLCEDLAEEDLTKEDMAGMDDGHMEQICHDVSVMTGKGVAKGRTRVNKKVVVEKPIVRRSSRLQKIRKFDS